MKLNGTIVAVLLGLWTSACVFADASPTTQPTSATLINELQLRPTKTWVAAIMLPRCRSCRRFRKC